MTTKAEASCYLLYVWVVVVVVVVVAAVAAAAAGGGYCLGPTLGIPLVLGFGFLPAPRFQFSRGSGSLLGDYGLLTTSH